MCVGGRWWGNLKERDGLEGVDNIHSKQREFWIGFIWLRARTLGGLL
jgi:hypothetical protein